MWPRTPICPKGGSWCTRRSESPHISLPYLVHYLTLSRNPINICGWISSFIQTPEAFMTLVKQRDRVWRRGWSVPAVASLTRLLASVPHQGVAHMLSGLKRGVKFPVPSADATSTARQKRNMCVEQCLSLWSVISSEHLTSWLGPSPYLCLDIQRS